MAWRLRLAPEKTNIDFFKLQWITFGGSFVLMVLSFVAWGVMGLNYGIDFKGGTTFRTDSATVIDTALYRATLDGLGLGDVVINEVFDPSFRADQHVAAIRLSAANGQDQIDDAGLKRVSDALTAMDPALKIVSVETVGPKVSSELVWSSIIALAATSLGIWPISGCGLNGSLPLVAFWHCCMMWSSRWGFLRCFRSSSI